MLKAENHHTEQKASTKSFKRMWVFSISTLGLLFWIGKAHVISSSLAHSTFVEWRSSSANTEHLGIWVKSAKDPKGTNQVCLVKKKKGASALSQLKQEATFLCTWLGTLHIPCPVKQAWQTVGETVVFLIWTSCSQMRTESHFKQMASGSEVMLQLLLMHAARERSE